MMCVSSMVGDHYRDMWTPRFVPYPTPNDTIIIQPTVISREEFEILKREVQQMKDLLKRAKAYDEKNGEPDCAIDEKMQILRKVAKLVGVELDDVMRPGAK
jgi:hypothetical protein